MECTKAAFRSRSIGSGAGWACPAAWNAVLTTFRRPSYFAGSGFLQSQRRTSTEHLKRRKCSGFPLLFHLTARAGPAQPKHGELCGERAARGGALGGAACHIGWSGGAPELPQSSPRAPSAQRSEAERKKASKAKNRLRENVAISSNPLVYMRFIHHSSYPIRPICASQVRKVCPAEILAKSIILHRSTDGAFAWCSYAYK